MSNYRIVVNIVYSHNPTGDDEAETSSQETNNDDVLILRRNSEDESYQRIRGMRHHHWSLKPIDMPTNNNTLCHFKRSSETAEDFVQRCPPSKALNEKSDTFNKAVIAVSRISTTDGLENFMKKGQELIESYEEKCMNEKINKQKELLGQELKEQIIMLAKEEKFLEGKWLLYPSSNEVDDIWLKIVQNTMAGHLGVNARIDGNHSQYSICLYTKDFTDEADVRRISKRIEDLQLLGKGIHYKCSAFSNLGIVRGNPFNIAPSIYHAYPSSYKSQRYKARLWSDKEEINKTSEILVARRLPSKELQSENDFISLYEEKREDSVDHLLVETCGKRLLDRFKSQINSASVPERYAVTQELKHELTQLAVECNFLKGQWIAYSTDHVDFQWARTVEGTINGALGINAIIKKLENNYEISVITRDFTDKADVMRVSAKMKQLGFKPPIFYKSQLYLKLGIIKNNEYGLNPNLHVEWSERPRMGRGNIVGQSRPPVRGHR